mmetsp:Transcript_22565/g.40142  ORF Transcript_22565/g.40142 Transcript_22565/m.40142 type:complete len:81 (-) Transcript_22565:155-397(-)
MMMMMMMTTMILDLDCEMGFLANVDNCMFMLLSLVVHHITPHHGLSGELCATNPWWIKKRRPRMNQIPSQCQHKRMTYAS